MIRVPQQLEQFLAVYLCGALFQVRTTEPGHDGKAKAVIVHHPVLALPILKRVLSVKKALTNDVRLRIFLSCCTLEPTVYLEIVRISPAPAHTLRDIQAPAVYTLAQPMPHYAVFAVYKLEERHLARVVNFGHGRHVKKAVIRGLAPHRFVFEAEELSLQARGVQKRFGEQRVLVAQMVEHAVQNHSKPGGFQVHHQRVKADLSAQMLIYRPVIADVITVARGRIKNRVEPQRVYAQFLQVGQALTHAFQVAAVAGVHVLFQLERGVPVGSSDRFPLEPLLERRTLHTHPLEQFRVKVGIVKLSCLGFIGRVSVPKTVWKNLVKHASPGPLWSLIIGHKAEPIAVGTTWMRQPCLTEI